MDIYVGQGAQESGEYFSAMVCTPQWLIENFTKDKIVIGRHHFIVQQYDYSQLTNKIIEIFESVSGDNWQAICFKLGRLVQWKFEDYNEELFPNVL